MKSFLAILAASAAVVQPALAHYRFTSLIANGTTTTAYQYVRQNTNYNSPVNVPSTDLRCNTGADLGTPLGTETATVLAGSTVGFEMDQAIYHPGPVQAYISKAPAAAGDYDGSGEWAKIYEITPTFDASGAEWNDAVATFTFPLPKDLANGQYLLRIEQIALHASPAQFYLSCAQINVIGGGSATPPAADTIELPSGYPASTPGIAIAGDIYYPIMTSYEMPGPAVWTG